MKIISAIILCFCFILSWAKPVKVTPRKRYRAEFEARATGQVFPEEFRHQGVKLKYAGVELCFTDRKGRKFVRMARGSFFNLHSRKFVPCSIEFYAGEGVKLVKLVPNNAQIRNFRLVPVTGVSNLAIPLNHNITGQIRDFYVTPGDGDNSVFDVCDGKVYGDPIPISGGKRYRLTVNGYAGTARGLRMGVEFYTHDRGGRKASVRSSRTQIRITGKKKQVVYNFVAPEKARWMRITMMWGYVRNYKVEEIQ